MCQGLFDIILNYSLKIPRYIAAFGNLNAFANALAYHLPKTGKIAFQNVMKSHEAMKVAWRFPSKSPAMGNGHKSQ
jgi:hypothetical protein